MNWIDAHCHLADSRFDSDRGNILARSRAAGVTAWVQGGVSPEDWDRQASLRQTLGDSLIPTIGLHPWWVHGVDDDAVDTALAELKQRLQRRSHGLRLQARACGELGLDALPRHVASLPRQQRAFESQLALAKEAGLPLVLHIVHAHEPAIRILSRFAPFPQGGLVHAFSVSAETAKPYLELGFHLSVGSGLLREGFAKLKKALPLLPADRLLIETDAPDGLPGTLNEPANLVRIAEAAAALRGETAQDILDRSAGELRRLFRMDQG